ncbi:hypothetical protein [Phycicoccus sp. Soil748]|uniref:hypothetical protein n=1 Tax=Intrasporangiaceae TaxID=85021 RepID=UPI000703019D|nr:hypothetical protein [Phycicoccus sp. Soil748]KRE54955.1 hypothetical protein ASG70_05780 [Phycicoccus sp. Soil748]
MSRLGLPGAASRCLGADLTAYADRTLDAATLLRWDRHVVACACCRAAVEDERRVLAALRSPSASRVPGDLRGMLLAMGAELSASSPADDRPDAGPAVRRPAVPPVPVAPVRVVDRGAPALHRSARRATVFAGLAAGATAAAAWSLVVTGGGVASPAPTVTPGTVQPVRPAGPVFATAVFTVPGLGARSTPGRSTTSAPGVGTARFGSAQSTP